MRRCKYGQSQNYALPVCEIQLGSTLLLMPVDGDWCGSIVHSDQVDGVLLMLLLN